MKSCVTLVQSIKCKYYVPEMSKKSRGFMDLFSDDDDFEPKAKPGIKSKRRANGDSDEDFAPVKQKKKQKKDEVPRKTSTQGKVDSVTATGTSLLRMFAIIGLSVVTTGLLLIWIWCLIVFLLCYVIP